MKYPKLLSGGALLVIGVLGFNILSTPKPVKKVDPVVTITPAVKSVEKIVEKEKTNDAIELVKQEVFLSEIRPEQVVIDPKVEEVLATGKVAEVVALEENIIEQKIDEMFSKEGDGKDVIPAEGKGIVPTEGSEGDKPDGEFGDWPIGGQSIGVGPSFPSGVPFPSQPAPTS